MSSCDPCAGPCGHCGWRGWCDVVASLPLCPDCLKSLGRGLIGPVTAATMAGVSCDACAAAPSFAGHFAVRYRTVPLAATRGVDFFLCPAHLSDLILASLSPGAWRALTLVSRARHGVDVARTFLLGEGWYDSRGRALQPSHGVQECD